MFALGPPAYLYVGVDDVRASIDFYERALGAEFLWHFRRFGTEVAAVRVSDDGPQVLLAEHRPMPSCLPIWTVPDLDALVARPRRGAGSPTGASPTARPTARCTCCAIPTATSSGSCSRTVPDALVARYADPSNDAASGRAHRGS